MIPGISLHLQQLYIALVDSVLKLGMAKFMENACTKKGIIRVVGNRALGWVPDEIITGLELDSGM